MCPDRQILSLYIDGELPSPWKEKIETHLASCGACSSRLDGYRKLRSVLLEDPREDAMKRAQERVWDRFPASLANAAVKAAAGVAVETNEAPFTLVKNEKTPGWKRSVSLPLPAAAAAAAVFVIAALFAIRGFMTPAQARPYEQVSGIGADLQGIVPISDMAGILQYLSGQEAGEYVIIQLPETRNFSSNGEPALIRAADYSGRTSQRRAATP